MARTFTSYFQKLKFDPSLRNHWWAKYIIEVRFVIMLIFAMIVLGIFGYTNIPRRLNPEINIAIVTISTLLPGASPEDVEQLITIPLEDAIEDIKDIDTMTSTSVETVSSIAIQFRSGVDGDKARDEVKAAVDSVNDLPEDATTPRVTKLDFEDEPVWSFAITTASSQPSLMAFSKILQERVEELPKVDRVVLSGYDDQRIEVVLDPVKAHSYGLTPLQISQIIQRAASSYPSGSLETGTSTFSLTIDRDILTVDDVRNTRITVNGQSLRLGDIAAVSFISKSNQNKAFLASRAQPPTETVHFFVYKSKTADIDAAENDAHALVDKILTQHDGQFKLTTIVNNAEDITEQFTDLAHEFTTTVILVFLLLLIFLGLRQAIISSITVPLTFLSSFAVIHALGLSLNFLTTFSFLIALGVLIDDAIVVVAAMTRYYATGRFTPAETGILVWRDFIVPLISTAITTIWAFVPLLLAGGIIGEFIKTIPLVVTITMISSTIIALFITLPLMVVFLKPSFPPRVQVLLRILGILLLITPVIMLSPKNATMPLIVVIFIGLLALSYRIRTLLISHLQKAMRNNRYLNRTPALVRRISDRGLLDIEVLSRLYMRVIDRILVSKHGKRSTMIAVIAFTLIAYLLVPLGLVKSEFFPKQDANILFVTGELASGTNLPTNTNALLNVLETIRKTDNVSYMVGETGSGFSADMGGRSGSANSFLITLHLTDMELRTPEASDIAEELREKLKNYQGVKLTVQELSGGPPAGADVQIKILGDDLTVLDQYATKVVSYLEKQPGVTNVNKSIKPGTSKLVFVPDREKLVQHNLSIDSVALWLRTYASGFTLDTITLGTEKKDVIFRLSSETPTPEDLGQISIPTQVSSVPLMSVGSLKLAANPTIITREKGKRTISVSAAITAGHNIQEINQKLEEYARTGLGLQEGYTWQTGGVNEENQKSVESILQAMILSSLLILVTMVIEFRSFRQTFIALAFIPLSISGVFYIFALTATPLSFPALIGVLALFGIVVRHAIVVIEKINDDIKEGMTVHEAVVDAAGNRLEPVLLTSLAAIVGLIPITIADPLWRGLGGAIIAGLLFSGIIKLFFVPIVYYMWYGGGQKKRKI
jgi:multidrug efflux pump